MIEDWMPQLASTLGQISGIKQVHIWNDLPGVLLMFPSLIILPVEGTQTYGAGAPGIGMHYLRATLYTAPQVLPEAYGTAIPFIGHMTRKLAANLKLGGLSWNGGRIEHVLPFGRDGNWYRGPGAVAYGDNQHIGIVFSIEVKENVTLTVTA